LAGLACAIFIAPLYGLLCRRWTLKRVLPWTIVACLFPGFLNLAVSGPWQAIGVAILVGLPTAFGHIALFDLLRRACPRDLEGTAITLSLSALALGVGAGELVGAWLYTVGGFAVCLVADALANAAVLPLLGLLPNALVSRRDGEREGAMSTN
jgi:MFS family permease